MATNKPEVKRYECTTDCELLELAAKASGILTPSWYGNEAYIKGMMARWNPLEDDGDALRLAVDLKIRIGFRPKAYADTPSGIRFFGHHDGDDAHTRTRLAIVRAAAEIGKCTNYQSDSN